MTFFDNLRPTTKQKIGRPLLGPSHNKWYVRGEKSRKLSLFTDGSRREDSTVAGVVVFFFFRYDAPMVQNLEGGQKERKICK